jgi:hypothetical protein
MIRDATYLLFKGETKKAKLLFQAALIYSFVRLFPSKGK